MDTGLFQTQEVTLLVSEVTGMRPSAWSDTPVDWH